MHPQEYAPITSHMAKAGQVPGFVLQPAHQLGVVLAEGARLEMGRLVASSAPWRLEGFGSQSRDAQVAAVESACSGSSGTSRVTDDCVVRSILAGS